MRIEEILSGKGKLALPITNEESILLDKIKENNGLDLKTLIGRERNLVELMIRRDIVYIEGNTVKFNELSGPEF